MPSFFVDPVIGRDTNPGTTPSAPFATIARAFTDLRASDTLHLEPSAPYPPSVFPDSLPGTEEFPITITSANDRQVIFDGGLLELARVGNAAWEPAPGGHPDEWRTRQIFTVTSG